MSKEPRFGPDLSNMRIERGNRGKAMRIYDGKKDYQYFLGLMLNNTRDQVLLQRKSHPAFQKGALNGIGGKLYNPHMSLREHMEERFRMETGIQIDAPRWIYAGQLIGPNWKVLILTVQSKDSEFEDAASQEGCDPINPYPFPLSGRHKYANMLADICLCLRHRTPDGKFTLYSNMSEKVAS
jgi:hypothetical protein